MCALVITLQKDSETYPASFATDFRHRKPMLKETFKMIPSFYNVLLVVYAFITKQSLLCRNQS